jgi:hypothetical protein
LEFVVLAAFMLLFFLVVTIGIQNQLLQAHVSRNEELVSELASVINNEAVLAASVEDGYSRSFTLPALLDSSEYYLQLYDNVDLVITFRGEDYLFFLDANLTNTTPLEPGEVWIEN